MTKWQRVKSVLGGLAAIAAIPFLMLDPELGCVLIALILGVSASLKGLQMLIYYFSMARHMVGGKNILYQGVIILDFGLFTIGFATVPGQYIMVYLLLGHLFYGLVGLLRAMEIREKKMGSWRFKFLSSAVDIALAILCMVQINSIKTMVAVYCLGLFLSAAGRIVSAFRRTAVVYVPQP